MTVVGVPDEAGRALLGQQPDGGPVIVWDGGSARPVGIETVEFLVGQSFAGPPTAESFAQLPALRVIQVFAAGVETWLPAIPDGVTFCNGRGINGAAVAELAIAGLLDVVRDLPRYARQQRDHVWDRGEVRSLTDRAVLVLGAGDIGSRIARVCAALGARVTVVGRTARDGVRAFSELPGLLPSAEVVLAAVPSTPDTIGLVDAGVLAQLPDGAIFVNVGRGDLVRTDHLLAELTAGRLWAVLDVTDPEPLPDRHPLWDAPNLRLFPHAGGGSIGWQARAYRFAAAQIERYRTGQPLENVVLDGDRPR
jgi:phosphoglycerate dehydrogenase-like enzyme